MGTALSARLIDASTSVMGFDVDPARCNAFGDIGGKPAPIAQMLKDAELPRRRQAM
jgi:3-hydroxyisobutyrate dehydrogenase-like beta-hydroxyacid dehydrogenase